MSRRFVGFLLVLLAALVLAPYALAAQAKPKAPGTTQVTPRGRGTTRLRPRGRVIPQAQQQPCLPEDEPCGGGGGGSGSVTVTPDDGEMTVYTGTTNNVAEFLVANNYSSSYTYALTCIVKFVGTCTAIKNASGTTITSITLPANGQAEVAVHFGASATPTSGSVNLTANNGVWSDGGSYMVSVTPPPAIVSVTPDSGTYYTGANTSAPYVFTVANLGLASQSYTLSCSIVGAGTCGSVVPSSVTLAAGANTQVTVTATSGATNGRVVLTAGGDAADAGAYYLTVLPGTPGALTATIAAPMPGPDLNRSRCLTIPLGDDAAAECGDLRITHPLPTIALYGTARTLTLLYSSGSAVPAPVVAATVTVPAGRLVPQSVEAILRVNGVERTRGTWSGQDWLASASRRLALTYSAIADTSGVYPYELEIASQYPTGRHAVTVAGQLVVLNRASSPFGAGWWVAGLEGLAWPGAPVMRWIGGDGSSRRYTLVAPNVWTAANPTRPDTIRFDGTKYLRILPGGGSVQFDATGRHVATVNRQGRATTFGYDANSLLQSVTLQKPGGTESYTLAYSAGKLTTVTAPPIGSLARVVVATIAGGKLVSLKDPDFSLVTFAYSGGDGRVTSRTDRRGITTSYMYQAGLLTTGTVSGMTQSPMPVIRHQQTLGLCCVTVDTARAYTRIDGPRTDVVDTTVIVLNGGGLPTRVISPIGGVTQITYGDARWPGSPTRAVFPTGRVTSATFDARGLMTSQTDSSRFVTGIVGDVGVTRYATMRYEYNPRWLTLTKQVSPEGDSLVIAYDSATGNRLWQQNATGLPSRVTYSYNGAGQVTAVRQGGVRVDSVAYDGLGNVEAEIDAMGFVVGHSRDQIGRDTLTTSPLDSLGLYRFSELRRYDIMDRTWLVRSFGPALQEGASDTLEVRSWFNREGLLDSLSRRAIPDPANVGWVTTRYLYDNFGRKVRDTDALGASDSVVFDPAGNAVALRNRRGYWINSQYDAQNRLTRRVIPSVTYGRTVPEWSNNITVIHKDTLPDGSYIVPGDTLVFDYDLGGNQILADNSAAQVRRVYDPSGLLVSDTLRIRTYASLSMGGSFTQHQYVVGHEYDLNGRRIATIHPQSLAPTGVSGPQNRETYIYNSGGRVATVTDIQGSEYRFHYDPVGRLDTLSFPSAQIQDVFSYDALGRVSQHVGIAPRFAGTDSGFTNGIFRQDLVRYDGRGKVVWAGALKDTATTYYNARGAVVHSDYIDATGAQRKRPHEDFSVDALLNVLWKDYSDEDTPRLRRTYRYQAGSGRLVNESRGGPYFWDQYFDLSGNTVLRHQEDLYDFWPGPPDGIPEVWHAYTRSMYSADNRLVAAEVIRNLDAYDTPIEQDGDFQSFFDVSRYDALGRRVLRRSRGLLDCRSHNLVDCVPAIERYVYDGDALLWEIRARGEDSVSAAGLEQDGVQLAGDSRYLGRVGYTNGPGLDHPLGMFRIGYGRDYGDGAGFKSFGVLAASLHYTWRGLPDLVTFENGSAKRCLRYYTGTTLRTRCVEMLWPVRSAFLAKQKHALEYAPSWMGSIANDGEDPTGPLYRRNRFYDPTTGRFTQEDPVGLLGGYNLYAYAGGDPIQFTDPFGLDKIYQDVWGVEITSRRVKQPGEDVYFLVWQGKDYPLDYKLQPGNGPYQIKTQAEAEYWAVSMATAAEPMSRATAAYQSLPGNKLDFKSHDPLNEPRTLFLIDGTMMHADKVGNMAWGYYTRTKLDMSVSEALGWARRQGMLAGLLRGNLNGEDPLDGYMIERAWNLPWHD